MITKTNSMWYLFKSSKLSYYSFLILLFLSLSSLLSEFIANDKPLIVYHNSSIYFPFFQDDIPEKTFGMSLDSPTDYNDEQTKNNIEKYGWILFPLIPYAYDSIDYKEDSFPSPPNHSHWLGTDDRGRDILSRVIYGYRISIFFGLLLTVVSFIIGVILGSIQGYYGGYVDLIGQRLVEFWSGVPVLFLLILISSFIEIGFWTLLFVMSIFSWLGVVEFVRAETLKVKNCEYVFASKVLGANDWHIVVKHIIPNATISAFSILPFMFAGAIATLTSLDFLGFGLPSSYPSLGEIVEQAKNNFQCVWIVWTAFLSISVLLLLVVFVGDGIKKAVTKTF